MIKDEIDYKYTEENGDNDLVKMFKALDPNKKWKLSTDKYADNELFIFGLQYEEDHPSKFLIINPGDLSYVEYSVFTKEELDEILNFEKTAFASITCIKTLDEYNLKTAADLRSALRKITPLKTNLVLRKTNTVNDFLSDLTVPNRCNRLLFIEWCHVMFSIIVIGSLCVPF